MSARAAHGGQLAGLLLPVLLVAIAWLPGAAGWFIGDDIASVHKTHTWLLQDVLWSRLAEQFGTDVVAHSPFYRPLIILSLVFNYLLAGTDYAGWYLVNLATHLGAVALVVVCIGRVCALRGGADPRSVRMAAVLAALWFGLCPLLAEGVYWAAARSDASVTLLSLAGVALWVGRDDYRPVTWALPALLVAALMFKESAAVLPLQVSLLWLAAPSLRTPARSRALLACFGIVALFLLLRAFLFGSALGSYAQPGDDPSGIDVGSVFLLLRGIGGWWLGLMVAAPWLAGLFAATTLAAATLPLGGVARWRLPLTLFAAAAGMIAATLLNVGGLMPSGEGGRLFHTPAAWIAVGIGVALAAHPPGRRRAAALVSLVAAVALALPLQQALLGQAVGAQQGLRDTVSALPALDERLDEPVLLLVPDRLGPVVVGRNAQGALVMPPLQPRPLLARILPTLPGELAGRHAQYGTEGLLDVFERLDLQYWDLDAFLGYDGPRRPRWPSRIACWSQREGVLVDFAAPPAEPQDAWAPTILAEAVAAGCRLQ
jgi:hypothetical protein